MARYRTIKPELWTDPAFVECSSNARLLFVAGLNFASDYGVLPDNARQLKMQCFPGDNVDVEPLIDELVAVDLWQRVYTPDDEKVLLVRTFQQHQRVDRPSEGRYGNPDDWGTIRRVLDEHSSNVRRPLDLERKKERENVEADRFDEFWNAYPRKESKKPAHTSWRRLSKTDREAALDALPRHVTGWRGTDRRFIPLPASWLNARRWEDDIATAPAGRKAEAPGGGFVGGDW